MNSYRIPLTKTGRPFFEQRDTEVERAVCFLIDRMGIKVWQERRQAVDSRLKRKLRPAAGTVPIEGVSLRERNDEIGWYLYLAEQSIADPLSLETDQASRVLPYFNAIGRNLDSILQIRGIDGRIDRLLRNLPNQDPDQVIFELLVGACYVNEGWAAEAIEEGPKKTPDFLLTKGSLTLDAECKRLSRRSEYTDKERDAWLRQWQPAQAWLVKMGIPLILTITFHEEVTALPDGFLLNLMTCNISLLLADGVIEDSGKCTIKGILADFETIRHETTKNYIKCFSSRERQVITGIHRPDFGLTYAIKGSRVSFGQKSNRMNEYWQRIDFVTAAYWRCDAEAAENTKARNIITRLSGANNQLSGDHLGVVHIGIEASEGDRIEVVRSEKIDNALAGFDLRGKPLEWVFLHYFKGEAPPDGLWTVDESCAWRKMGTQAIQRPLSNLFLVLPPDASSRSGVHWA